MRSTILAAALGLAATEAIAADAAIPESLLNGTRWMAIGVDKVEDIPLEKLLVLHDCFIADIAFLVEDGKLTRFDRSGLSGKSLPLVYVRIELETGLDGTTLVTLHTATDGDDKPDRYVIDAAGTIMRARLETGDGPAYMKCDRGVTMPPAPPPLPGAAR